MTNIVRINQSVTLFFGNTIEILRLSMMTFSKRRQIRFRNDDY